MKKFLLGILAVLTLVMSGCGDASVAVVIPVDPVYVVSPPSITSYSFTKNTTTEFINGSVDFYAPDSDIDFITVVSYNSLGYEMSRTTTYVNVPNTTYGTIPFKIDYLTFPSSLYAYTFSVYLTDFNGYTSNQAVDTFYVP